MEIMEMFKFKVTACTVCRTPFLKSDSQGFIRHTGNKVKSDILGSRLASNTAHFACICEVPKLCQTQNSLATLLIRKEYLYDLVANQKAVFIKKK